MTTPVRSFRNHTATPVASHRPPKTVARGFLIVEVAVALTLVALLTVLTVRVISDYMHARDYYKWRQTAAWAAQAQLDRYAAGAAIDSSPPEGMLPAEVSLATQVQPGTEQWAGFKLVTVTAQVTRRHQKPISAKASRYLRIQDAHDVQMQESEVPQ